MQIRFFTIPIMGGEAAAEELNAFLRSKKVIQVDQHLANEPGGSAWCFCVRYMEDYSPYNKGREKVDYKKVLDEAVFQRFSRLREVRKQLAMADGVQPFMVFTDEELAELAKIEDLTEAKMAQVKGVGPKKMEKYARHFVGIGMPGETENEGGL